MAIRLLGTVTPILMMGESHSLAFRDLLFHPSWSEQYFLCRTRFMRFLPSSMFAVNQSLHPDFAQALVQEDILDGALVPAFLNADTSEAFIMGAPSISPAVVFFGGDIELVDLYKKLGDNFDFELPDDPGYGVDRSKQPIPYTDIREEVARLVTPFVTAIASLSAHGFTRLMIHALPPRTANEDKAAIFMNSKIVPAPVRAKIALLANRQMALFCEHAGIGFIDTWEETCSAEGYLRPEFELDGMHVNRRSAVISLEKIVGHLFDRTAGSWNPDRYELLLNNAQRRAPHVAALAAWREDGVAAVQLDPQAVGALAAGLEFHEAGHNPHARTDWNGWPRSGRPGVELAGLPEAALVQLRALLAEGDADLALHAGADCELNVISARPVRMLDGPADPLGERTAPPGVRRALLQLSAGAAPQFESLEGQAVAAVVDAVGMLVAYDPQRLRVRQGTWTEGARLIEMVLIPRLPAQPFRVLAAGLCEWPSDPFQYSVAGMRAAPALEADTFSARAWRPGQ